jgi:hypothetical protein
VILQYGDNTSSVSSDEGLTTLECETLRAETTLICLEEKEVNMNLQGGKVLPDLQNPHKNSREKDDPSKGNHHILLRDSHRQMTKRPPVGLIIMWLHVSSAYRHY